LIPIPSVTPPSRSSHFPPMIRTPQRRHRFPKP